MAEKSIFPDDFGTRHNPEHAYTLLKSGFVVAADAKTCTVQISEPDKGIITRPLRVMQRSCVGAQDFHLPRLGEFVHVLHTPGETEAGIVLGATFTDQNPPPINNSSSLNPPGGRADSSTPPGGTYSRYIRMDDGTEIYVDSGNKIFINAARPVELHAAGEINLVSQSYVYVTCANAKIQAGTTEITGNLTVDQDVLIKGKLTVNGFSALQGGGTTTPHMLNADGSSQDST